MSDKNMLYGDITLSTDSVMQKCWITLFEDFQTTYGHDYKPRGVQLLQKGDFAGFRDYIWPTRRDDMSPYFYKWSYQLENFFKRYRFASDKFNDKELSRMTREKFRATQERCASPLKITVWNYKVIQRARRIIRGILGEYSEDRHRACCRHGKRACQGTPYLASYLDQKLLDQPFTCSSEHLDFFARYCEGDDIMQHFLDVALKENRIRLTRSLEYAEVPKSWKIHRSMMPNTLIGAFVSAGLGEYIAQCLRDVKINIKRLQPKHQQWAREASAKGHYVTADLSAASDSLTLQLLRMLLSTKWYRALTRGRALWVKIDGESVLLSSVLTMGLGSTFPLQTLVFYALVKALGELDGRKHFVSVYGDDLIYSRHLHKYVRVLFPAIHLILNEDKTYAEGHFRESCGGDYYRGVDVRPYQPEGGCEHLVGPRKQEFLYRLYNGLCRRWDEVEIPKTLLYLRMELLMCSKGLLQVPPSYPDGSGIRVERPRDDFWFSPVLWSTASHSTSAQGAPVSFLDGRGKKQRWNSGDYIFQYLHSFADDRCVQTVQLPYYWEKLRSSTDALVDLTSRSRNNTKHRQKLMQILHSFRLPTGDFYAEYELDPRDSPAIIWRKAQKNPRWIRSKLTGQRFRRLVAMVSKKGSTHFSVTEARLSSWC